MSNPPRPGRPTSVVAAAVALLAGTPAAAEQIDVVLRGSTVEVVHSAGAPVGVRDFRPGRSRGAVLHHVLAPDVHAADDRDLESYFARNATSPDTWEIELDGWTTPIGPAAHFFVFEVGGNDTLRVNARFAGGALGTEVTIPGWHATPHVVETGPNAGQRVYGTGFRVTDLRRPDGTPAQASDVLESIVIRNENIDGASFLVRERYVNDGTDGDGSHTIEPATPRVSSPMRVAFEGPWVSETDLDPHPFLDYRMDVTFTGPGGGEWVVPGHFDGDGARGDVGNRWVARFAPTAVGTWTASVSFRTGDDVAVDANPLAGSAWAPLDGRTFRFTVDSRDPAAEGFHRYGTLRDEGAHYRRFQFGPWFLKTGVNSPENLLAYRGFDGVTKVAGSVGNLHSYAPHHADWRPGDPLFDRLDGEDGRGIVGALNYLSDEGVNSVFAILMNKGGDGDDAHPFIGIRRDAFDRTRYDTSRLRQWDVVFEHAARRGIALNLVFGETEPLNETWLDGGAFGDERKLLYREMVSRFAHHGAIKWNLTEENDFAHDELRDMAAWLASIDPYGHSISVHNHFGDLALFQSLAGDPNFHASSAQYWPDQAGVVVEQIRSWSANAGDPWTADLDENAPYVTGLSDTNADELRKRALWDVYLSGGGLEWYLGWQDLPLGGDLTIEDFRTRAPMWRYMRHASALLEDVPFWTMHPDDDLVTGEDPDFGGAEVFVDPGERYLVYLPDASNGGRIDLSDAPHLFSIRWYDPRNGGYVGQPRILGFGDSDVDLGLPPSDVGEDWVADLQRLDPLWARTESGSVSAGDSQDVVLRVGPAFAGRPYVLLTTLSGTSPGYDAGTVHVPINPDRWTRFGLTDVQGHVFRDAQGVVPPSGVETIHVQLSAQFTGGLVGTTMHHAVVLTSPVDYATNAVELVVLP